MADGSFEAAETQLVGSLLRDIDVFVDVGANAGYYTCLARQAGKTVLAVEPQPNNVRLLYTTLESNDWSDVEVWPVALADRTGSTQLYGAGTGASLIGGWAGGSVAYRQRVAVTVLDQLLRTRFERQRLFVKIDVEGAEDAVLRGAAETIERRPRPTWLIEITLDLNRDRPNPYFEDVFQTFWRAGYQSATADADRRPVTPEDVRHWVRQGTVGFGSHNWIFTGLDEPAG